MADVSKLKRSHARRPAGTRRGQQKPGRTGVDAPADPRHGGESPARSRTSGYERLDGRSLRRSNRIVQFATRVTPEFDRRIREIARDERLLIVEVLERALDAYESQRQGGG